MHDTNHIRNFVVIAHIDHGKSTLADRFLELTHTVETRSMKPQLLDQMDLERERGITIKMQPVRMIYHSNVINEKLHSTIDKKSQLLNVNGQLSSNSEFILNLIDTPGHIDFSYEVSRALAAVEGAVLLVDATQGVQAQTLTNLHIAEEQGLTIIPAVNKIDMAEARVEEAMEELASLLHISPADVSRVSGKTGVGVLDLLERVIHDVPPPHSARSKRNAASLSSDLHDPAPDSRSSAFRALIFDSLFESHRGVIAFVRVMDGKAQKGDKAYLHATDSPFEIKEVGEFHPRLSPTDVLCEGEIGYVVTGIKDPEKVRIGDTIFLQLPAASHYLQPLSGYHQPRPVVWASVFPEDEREYDALRDALGRLRLNDASLTYEPESSPMLGRSFLCGFLGMLHLEIVTERLKREFSVSVVVASPSIAYEVTKKGGEAELISSAAKFPAAGEIQNIQEPWMSAEIIVPGRFLGDVLRLVDAYEGRVLTSEHFGSLQETEHIRVQMRVEMPMREIVSDFFDALKSVTSGYASLAYTPCGMREACVERIDIQVAGELVPALARIVSKEKALTIARSLVAALKDVLPRQLFLVKIQAVVEGRIVASESLSALKKDVTGYLYGGDRSRKMKLWKKQKRGKKKLAATGSVRIPPEAYLQVLKRRGN